MSGVYAGEDPRDIVLLIDSLATGTYALSGTGAVSDSSGNGQISDTLYFKPSQRAFRPTYSFVDFLPDSLQPDLTNQYRIWPDMAVGVHFSSLPADNWEESITVSDTSGNPVSYSPRTRDGVRIYLDDLSTREPIDVSVTDADTTHIRRYVRASASLLGELSGSVRYEPGSVDVVVELVRDDGRAEFKRSVTAGKDRSFRFTDLPGGSRYRIRYFADLDGNHRWHPGSLIPYRSPEPIGWRVVEEPVRARWETVVPDTLTINGN